MASLFYMMPPGGLVLAVVPLSSTPNLESLAWPEARTYGSRRLHMLTQGWDMLHQQECNANEVIGWLAPSLLVLVLKKNQGN